MQVKQNKHSEDFWIQVVEGSVDEGEPVICVPLAAFSRATAIRLAMKLNMKVFIKGSDYLFSTTEEATQKLLKEVDTLH
jgi:hypothetical protein